MFVVYGKAIPVDAKMIDAIMFVRNAMTTITTVHFAQMQVPSQHSKQAMLKTKNVSTQAIESEKPMQESETSKMIQNLIDLISLSFSKL